MNVRDLLRGMESRAMDGKYLKDISALYDPQNYGDTEPDCEVGYQNLLPLLSEEQKRNLEKM